MPFGSVAEHPSDPGGRRTRTHVFRSRVLLEQRGFEDIEMIDLDTIDVSNRILRSVESELQDMGYPTRRTYLSYHFAGVHAIRLTPGGWDGGADPGRDGMALKV